MFHCLGWLMPYVSFMTGCKLVLVNNVKPGADLVPVFIDEKVIEIINWMIFWSVLLFECVLIFLFSSGHLFLWCPSCFDSREKLY